MKAFLQSRQLIHWRSFALQALFVLPASLLAGCSASELEPQMEPTSLVVTAEIPFLELALSIDPEGEMELTPRLSPEKRFNLGPVGLKFGIEETVKLMGGKPHHLFILLEQKDGTIRRDEYKIGQKFAVRFDDRQRVTSIEGTGESYLLVVARIRPVIVPDTGLQVQSVVGMGGEPRPEPGPAPALKIMTSQATVEASESQPEREPELTALPEEEASRSSRAEAYPGREGWNPRPERSSRGTSEGVPLTVSVLGNFNEVYVEEVENSSAADMGDFEVEGEGGRYRFRLLKGKGAVVTLCGRENRVYKPISLDRRVRLNPDC